MTEHHGHKVQTAHCQYLVRGVVLLRRSEMFIDWHTMPITAPFGGAERCWTSTCQVEFRPSERRRALVARPSAIDILPLRGRTRATSARMSKLPFVRLTLGR